MLFFESSLRSFRPQMALTRFKEPKSLIINYLINFI
jgi:hypothetical protein